jgi:hypothetical protein
MIILSIDPGVTTGFAIVSLGPGGSITPLAEGEKKFPAGVRVLLRAVPRVDLVIFETFVLRKPLIGDTLVTVQVIGAVRYIVPEERLVPQTPLMKSRISDIILKKYGLLRQSKHVCDAYRHILVYALKEQANASKPRKEKQKARSPSSAWQPKRSGINKRCTPRPV